MNHYTMSRMLKRIAFIVIALGLACCFVNLGDFNDRNLGLMVGIGFLVGGLQILLFGAIAPLMQRQETKPASSEPQHS